MIKLGARWPLLGYNQSRPVGDQLYESQIKLNDLNRGEAKIVTMRQPSPTC